MKTLTAPILFCRKEASAAIQQISVEAINELCGIWRRMFGQKNVVEHFQALPGHIKIFFGDIIDESKSREQDLLNDVLALKEEYLELKRMLRIEEAELEGLFTGLLNEKPLNELRTELDAQLEAMREEVQARSEEMRNFIDRYAAICEELEEPFEEFDDTKIPTSAEMLEFQKRYTELEILKAERLKTMDELRFNIKGYCNRLEIFLDEEQTALVELKKPGVKTFMKLQKLEAHLKTQFDELCAETTKMMEKINNLWNFLQISPNPSIANMLEKPSAFNQTNHCKLLEELNKCEAIKRENMEKYVNQVRLEILTLWDLCYISEKERQRFNGYHSDVYTEDLLKLHELELEDLKNFYENNKNIFDLMDEWSALWSKVKEHDVKALDPNRYNNRGGQLLREEKERRALHIRLPKVEAQIFELCNAYESTHGKAFTINGKTVKAFLEDEYEKREEEKKTRQATHASARKNTGTTPLHQSRMNTPLGGGGIRNRTLQSGMKGASSTTKLSALKPTLTRSTQKRPTSPLKAPHSKRNLLPQMNETSRSQLLAIQPLSRQIKRRSIKRDSIKSRTNLNRSKRHKKNRENLAPNSSTSDTTSYDVFEVTCSASSTIRTF